MEAVLWREWNKKTFKLARKEKKLILLGITAGWCHWCRVMEQTTYSDPRVKEMIRKNFIPIKVDTDRRPDINSRYNLGGWPTTACLRPDGSLITGATFLEPDQILKMLNEAVQSFTAAGQCRITSTHAYPIQPPLSGKIEVPSMQATRHFSRLLISHFDPINGGFGNEPKFPMPQALNLSLALAAKEGAEYSDILGRTLTKMAHGEIFDQKAGGFFRYAARADWSAPHWEKLLIDQADLALVYLNAFSLTGEPFYANIAGKTLDYIETTLLKPYGRFAASQASDERYYRIPSTKTTQPAKPPLDTTVIAGWNARACSAFIKADSVINRPGAADISLRALNFLFNKMKARNGLFCHYYDDGKKNACLGLLADQIYILTALLDAFEASANVAFATEAMSLADTITNWLQNQKSGALFDRLPRRDEIGALNRPRNPIEINAEAAIAFLRLTSITGNQKYEKTARAVLGAFGVDFEEYGLLAADYARALFWLLSPRLEIFLTGKREAIIASGLWRQAKSIFNPQKVVIVGNRRPIKPPPVTAPGNSEPAALVCVGRQCLAPAGDPAELTARLKQAA